MATPFEDAIVSIRTMINDDQNGLGLKASEEFVNKVFKQYAFTNQERGVILAELVKIDMQQKTALFIDGAIKAAGLQLDLEAKQLQVDLLKEQIELEKIKQKTELTRTTNLTAQAALVYRQQKNYDDALQKKVMETSGSYANYAVIADPAGAQGPLDNFKIELQNLKNRITQRGLIPVPVATLAPVTGNLIETFTVDLLSATIEHRTDDYLVSSSSEQIVAQTYEIALGILMDYLGL